MRIEDFAPHPRKDYRGPEQRLALLKLMKEGVPEYLLAMRDAEAGGPEPERLFCGDG